MYMQFVNLDKHNRGLSSTKETVSPLCYLLFWMRLNLTELSMLRRSLNYLPEVKHVHIGFLKLSKSP